MPKCENAKQSFYNDTSLEKVTIGKCERIQDWSDAFLGCISLREINATLNMSVVNWASGTFDECTSLQTIRFEKETVKRDLSFASCKSLSKESMESLFDGLAVLQGGIITLSRYAFENNYPTADERKEVENRIAEKELVLA